MDDLIRLLGTWSRSPASTPWAAPHRSRGPRDAAEPRTWKTGSPATRFPASGSRSRRDATTSLARFDSPRSRRTLLFDVHQDTVPTDGMTIAPFDPRIEGGRLYGRGSCDIKGGMAAMLVAVARLCRERPPGAASVVLACTVDEEFTHTGSSHLAGTDHGADLAIVAEPTLLDLVHCHKGALRWKIRTQGVACHSSTPQLGVNAIYRMGRVLDALVGYAGALAAATPDPIVGPPSLSVGRIEGGQSVNIVPDWCEIEIDRRLIPGEKPGRP